MKLQIFLLLLICSTLLGQAQQAKPVVEGQILGVDRISIPGVAVVMQTIDSVFVDAVVSDLNGYFHLESSVRPYRLLFQHLVYKPLSLEPSNDDIGVIILEENINELSGVTVTAERSMVRVEDGRLSYDLRSIIQQKIIDNAYDLVKELPSIMSDGTSLKLLGAMGNTDILISGKKSNMSFNQLLEYLRALPADRVERIEIVYNPPPEWHVEGSAINVVLKKEDKYALQGQLQGRYTNQYANSYMLGGSISLFTPKNSLDVAYNVNDTRSKNREQLQSLHTIGKDVYDIESDIQEKDKNLYHNLYVNFNHDFMEKSNLGITYVGKYSPRKNEIQTSTSNMFSNAYSRKNGDDYLHDISLTYAFPFKLNIGTEYTHSRSDALQTMQYIRSETPVNAFIYDMRQRINRVKVYADMAHTLPYGWQFSYGAMYDYTNNSNTQTFDDKENNGESNYSLSSVTKEHITNMYTGLKKHFFDGKLDVNASLTGELYKINDYKKNAFLPNITFTFTPVGKHVFQAGYRTLRRYPSYWTRQEYTSYSNEYMVSLGNPLLRPARYSFVNLLYILNSKYTFQVSYYKVKDFFISQSYQSPEELKLFYKTLNTDDVSSLNFNVTVPLKIGDFVSTNLTGVLYQDHYKSSQWFDLSYNRNKWSGILSMNNTFYLSKEPNITFNIYAFYQTPTIQGVWDLGCTWGVNAGIKWEMVKNRAILNLQCNDIFESQYPIIKVRYKGQHMNMDQRFYQRSIMLNFSYNFKGYKEKQQKAVDASRYGL